MSNHEYKSALNEERIKLTEELKSLGSRDPQSKDWEATPEAIDQSNADENTRADRFEGYEERTAILNTLEARLVEVESALTRLEDNTFGYCRVCNGPIEPERLTANPAAQTCMAHIEE